MMRGMSIMEFMRAVEDLALTYGIEVPDVFDFSAEAIALVYGGKPVSMEWGRWR